MGKPNEKTATLASGASDPALTAEAVGLSSHRLTLFGAVFGTYVHYICNMFITYVHYICVHYSAFQELFYAVKNG